MKSIRPLLALTLAGLVACGGGQQPEGDSPAEQPAEQPQEPDAPGEPAQPAARPQPSQRPSQEGAPEVRIVKPAEGAKLRKTPVDVEVVVDHYGELRSCRLGTLDGEVLGRETLAEGSGGGQPAGGSEPVAGGKMTDEDKSFSALVPSGSDGDKTIARAKIATQAITDILAEWTFNALRGERRRAVFRAAAGILRRERFRARSDGKYRLVAVVNMAEARNLVLDALAVQETFGAEPFVLGACGGSWWGGPKLEGDAVTSIRTGITAGAADWLNRWRFTQAPNAQDRAKVLKAAAGLQASPSPEELERFSSAFQAPLAITIGGGIAFERFTGGAQAKKFQGFLRVRGLTVTVYQRTTNTILARFALSSSPNKTNEDEATTAELHQPWVGNNESLSMAAERYARFAGRAIANNICRRLFDRYYADQGNPPRDFVTCPGCGDRVERGLSECPTCTSPLGGTKPSEPAKEARYRTRFRFQLQRVQDGQNKIRVVAIDERGRKGSDESSFHFHMPDTSPPRVRILDPKGDDLRVASEPLLITCEVTDDRQVAEVTVNGAKIKPPKGHGRTAWNFKVRVRLKEGKNQVAVQAKDGSGNPGRAFLDVTYDVPDLLPPQVSFVEPREGAKLTKAPVRVVVEAKDARGQVTVSVNGVQLKRAGTRFTGDVTPAEGKNELVAVASDEAGNRAREVRTFFFETPDTTEPTLKILAPASGKPITTAPVIVVVEAKDDRGVAWVKINGVKAAQDNKGRWRVKIQRPVDGANEIEAVAADAAGNTARLKGRFEFDSTPPEVEAKATILVEGKVDDLKAKLTINGRAVKYDPKTGEYSVRVAPHPDHPDKIEIVATDEFGNSRKEVRKVR